MTDREKLMTPKQAAERFIVSEKTVKDWLRAGTLKGVKVGHLWRIKEGDLQDFLKEP